MPADGEGYRAARTAAALAEPELGKLLLRGPDRRGFLHGLSTNDVRGLSPGRGQQGCVLTPQGRLVADFALYDLGDELLCVQERAATAPLLGALSKPLPLSETRIEDASDALAALVLAGPSAEEALRRAFPGLEPPRDCACVWASWSGERLPVAAYPRSAPGALLLLPPASRARELRGLLLERGAGLGLRVAGPEALEALRVEAGVPRFGPDLGADSLPLEVGLERAVSFDKGCYMGQEVTARMRHLRRRTRALAGLRLERQLPSGAPVLRGGVLSGRLGSVVFSPRLVGPLALALLRAEDAVPGTLLVVRQGDEEAAARVVALPLD